MKRIAHLTLALLIAAGAAACSKPEEAPKTAANANAAAPQLKNHARILQVIPAGSYTYVEAMGETGEKIWMAGAAIDAKAGDNISFGQYSMMTNYQSKTLGKTFERILFVEAWSAGGSSVAAVANHGTAPGGMPAGMAGAAPAGHPPMTGGMPMGAPAAAPAGGQNVGVVKSTTSAGGYTYVEVQQGNGSLWIAAPETAVKAGDKVSWEGGAVMNNFTAKSLNRTFDKIVFAGGIAVVK